jgi:hypothetical protein
MGTLFWVFAIVGPFALVPLVRWTARRFGRVAKSPGDEGRRRANRLALACEILPWLVLPAFMLFAWLEDRLADAGVIAPYPDVGVAAFLSAVPPAIGLVLGVIALVQLTLGPGRPLDLARARTGTALSWWAVAFAIIFGSGMQVSAESAHSDICSAHVRGLASAVDRYRAANDDRFPDASRWSDELSPYVEEKWGFICPEARKVKCGYAYNAKLSGLKYDRVRAPDTVVVFFESDAGWNAAGGPELLVAKPRHYHHWDTYGFVDGHVRGFDRTKTKPGRGELRWETPPRRR